MEISLTIYFELASKLQKDIADIKRIFVKHGSKYRSIPHVTLYSTRFDKKNFDKFVNTTAKLNFKKFIINIVSIERKRKFFRINIKKTKEISRLHKQILEMASPLRNKKLRANDIKRTKDGKFSERELELLNKCGTAMALDYYSPHITLGNVSQDVSELKLKDLFNKSKIALSHIRGKKILVDKITLILKRSLKNGNSEILIRKSIFLY